MLLEGVGFEWVDGMQWEPWVVPLRRMEVSLCGGTEGGIRKEEEEARAREEGQEEEEVEEEDGSDGNADEEDDEGEGEDVGEKG